MKTVWEINERIKNLIKKIEVVNNIPIIEFVEIKKEAIDTIRIWREFEKMGMIEKFEKPQAYEIGKVSGRMETVFYLLTKKGVI